MRLTRVRSGYAPGRPTPSLGAFSSQGWGGGGLGTFPRTPALGFLSLASLAGAEQDIGAAAGMATTGAGVATIVSTSSIAGPVGLAIGAGVAAAVILIRMFQRTGQQKVAATDIVNKVEPMMQQNLNAYLASNRTQSENAASQENFHILWDIVARKCSDPTLGSAGQRCISERQEGGIAPWGKNWFQMYLDPIRNDSTVIADPSMVTDPATGQVVNRHTLESSLGPLSNIGGFLGPEQIIPGVDNTLLLLGGAAILAVVLLGGSK